MCVLPVCKFIAPPSVRNSFHRSARVAASIILAAFILPGSAEAQVNVVTYHNDNARTGVNANETRLTPSNVNKNNFGKLFTQHVDGIVVGQPLYLSNVSIPGSGMHNVVYVATQHDSVYAFDADNNAGINAQPLWQVSFINPAAGITTVPGPLQGCTGVTAFTELGIVSTPVIDPNTGTLYVIAKTEENGTFVHRLHALDVVTGQEKFNGPVVLKATFRTNTGSVATFKDLYQMNRPGLLLANGVIYAGFGSNGCNYGNQGWVLAYDALTLQRVGAFDTSPVKGLSSIWQSGAGLTADGAGNIYAETGEGAFDADSGGQDFGSSVLKLTQTPSGLSLTDYFTPYNQLFLSQMDLDLSSAGVVVLPDQPGAHPHLAVATGKQGILYLLDCDSMGHYNPAGDTQIVQEVSPGAGGEVNGVPVYWNGKLYAFGGVSPIKAFSVNNGLLSNTPVFQSTTSIGGGHVATISANGNTNGILWVINGPNLSAYAASTLKLLYTSGQSGARDTLPTTAHFATQTVANGKVYVATRQNVVVYGLFPALLTVAGNNQTATVNTVLPVALKMKTVDPYSGQPLAGITVTFSDGGKGGTFSTTTPVTDANGLASTLYTLSKIARTVTITATAPGFASAVLTETGTPAAPKWIVALKGNNQSATVTTQLPAALVVKIADQYSNGVPGVTVNFNDGGAGGTFSSTSAITDSLGKATTLYTTSTKAALITITASALSLAPLHMHATATAGPAANLTAVSGGGQTGPASTQLAQNLVAHVSDQYGNAVPNASVVFSDGGAGGSFSAVPATSDTLGNASVAYTTPPASGVYHITASVSGVAATAAFTETVP